jgi:hypothetical protein
MSLRGGHYTDPQALTGWIVIGFDRELRIVVDVRGRSPRPCDIDPLLPGALVGWVNTTMPLTGPAPWD